MNWWLIVRRAGAVHCWPVGDTSDDARLQDLIARARILLGFPAGDDWIGDETRANTIQLTRGEPHPRLMAAATVHRLSDLDRVTPEAVTAYLAECDQAGQAARLADAQRTVDALPDADKAALRTRLGWTAAPRTTTGR